MAIRNKLANVYGALCSAYDASLRNQLASEEEYKQIKKTKRYCAMKLCQLVRNICNGSDNVEVEDVIGNILESLHYLLQT